MDGDHREVLTIRACWGRGQQQGARLPGRDTAWARCRLGDWRKRKRKRKRYGYEYDVLIFHNLIFLFIVLAFFDLSSLRTHFRPLPFPSENFGGHGKKLCGRPGTRLRRSYRVTGDADVTDSEEKRKRVWRRPACHYERKRRERRFSATRSDRNLPLFRCCLCGISTSLGEPRVGLSRKESGQI